VLGIAGCVVLAGVVVPPHVFSETVREVVEYLEYLLCVLIIPFSAWAIGLLQYVRLH
jgi:hypothetical protein